jgi:hypothetical protein
VRVALERLKSLVNKQEVEKRWMAQVVHHPSSPKERPKEKEQKKEGKKEKRKNNNKGRTEGTTT